MPFRKKQELNLVPMSVGLQQRNVVAEDGYVETIKVPFSEALPDSSMFDNEACIKAGVNLTQLNSRVLDCSTVSIVDDTGVKKDDE